MLGTIFGISVLLIVSHVAVLWAGARFKGWLQAIPIIGRLF